MLGLLNFQSEIPKPLSENDRRRAGRPLVTNDSVFQYSYQWVAGESLHAAVHIADDLSYL